MALLHGPMLARNPAMSFVGDRRMLGPKTVARDSEVIWLFSSKSVTLLECQNVTREEKYVYTLVKMLNDTLEEIKV